MGKWPPIPKPKSAMRKGWKLITIRTETDEALIEHGCKIVPRGAFSAPSRNTIIEQLLTDSKRLRRHTNE